jgi:hypothetical protein
MAIIVIARPKNLEVGFASSILLMIFVPFSFDLFITGPAAGRYSAFAKGELLPFLKKDLCPHQQTMRRQRAYYHLLKIFRAL